MNKELTEKQKIKKIEKIFQEAMEKLQDLHKKKMALLEHYHALENEKEIAKIRKNIKNNK